MHARLEAAKKKQATDDGKSSSGKHRTALESQAMMDETSPVGFFTNLWFYTGTVIPSVLPQMLLAAVVATAVYLWQTYGWVNISIPSNGHTAFGTRSSLKLQVWCGVVSTSS